MAEADDGEALTDGSGIFHPARAKRPPVRPSSPRFLGMKRVSGVGVSYLQQLALCPPQPWVYNVRLNIWKSSHSKDIHVTARGSTISPPSGVTVSYSRHPTSSDRIRRGDSSSVAGKRQSEDPARSMDGWMCVPHWRRSKELESSLGQLSSQRRRAQRVDNPRPKEVANGEL